MSKRFVSVWFHHLRTDWYTLRHPTMRNQPLVLSVPSHGRMVISAANMQAEQQGIYPGMVVADARAIVPSLQVFDDQQSYAQQLLQRMAAWCIRFSPAVSIDDPDGLIMDATGCTHLWGGDEPYLACITNRFKHSGYDVRAGIADTIGAAWAVTRFSPQSLVVNPGKHADALFSLPPEALRLETETIQLLNKLGFRQIGQLMSMPGSSLSRRFGAGFMRRLEQALGKVEEFIEPVIAAEPYQERLPCLEPIVTATGIEIALKKLLETVCHRLQQEQKGLRVARFTGYCTDGKKTTAEIHTHRASNSIAHIFKLFDIRLSAMEPGAGIELFVLEALQVEDHTPRQQKIWEAVRGIDDMQLSELVDRLAGKLGAKNIHRYLPDEHYWPERSVKLADSLEETPASDWKVDRPRPLQLLSRPQQIDVTAPIPDYPPMHFRYKGKLHTIKKADGPERIEQEWWLQEGEHRDYYAVEDEEGRRYWLFRSGHYTDDKKPCWYIHGFFA